MQLEAAERLLSDERDREQSMNGRAIALGAATLAQASILSAAIAPAVHAGDGFANHLADVAAGTFVGATLGYRRLVKEMLEARDPLVIDADDFVSKGSSFDVIARAAGSAN